MQPSPAPRVRPFRDSPARGFDNAVLRIATGYDDLGRVQLVTSYDNSTVGSGSVVNEVKHSYDNWSSVGGPLSKLEQDRDSAVSGGGNDLEVSYLFSKATSGRNTIRRSRVTLPDASQLTFTYSSSSSHDDSASRVTSFTKGVVKVAEYRYNGAGQVVGTDLAEADVMWNLYTTSGSYPDLDRFDRVVQSRWTKDLSTDRDFVDPRVGLDENGNVTYVDDQIQAGMDVKYTIDALDRLTKAEEGTYSAGSISGTTRQQVWEDATLGGLDQVGNWVRSKLDLNGDADFVDSGELDERRWHNVVNELTRRDTDNDGTDNHTLTYDAVGNLTNDGKDWKYQYDAFGRLRKVRTLADVVISEYTYNGLGHRIGMHQDTDTDGDCDASDKWYHFAYTERWQPVAVYRESDADPKELIVPHFAGAGGYGGSSYIDDVVLRDRDANTAWTAASDGTLEQRRYFCQNWRHDVVAMVSDLGKLAEQDRYTPYGLPWGIPLGDVDSDGDCDATDDTTVQSWIGGAYQVRGDVDLDGDVDAADRTIVQGNSGATLGRGTLSDIGNRAGYAGYVNDDKLAKLHHVRHRVLHSELGRWTTRDPLGYVDGPSLLEFCQSGSASLVDPWGLACVPPCPPGQVCACDVSSGGCLCVSSGGLSNPCEYPAWWGVPGPPLWQWCNDWAECEMANNFHYLPPGHRCRRIIETAGANCCKGSGSYAECKLRMVQAAKECMDGLASGGCFAACTAAGYAQCGAWWTGCSVGGGLAACIAGCALGAGGGLAGCAAGCVLLLGQMETACALSYATCMAGVWLYCAEECY